MLARCLFFLVFSIMIHCSPTLFAQNKTSGDSAQKVRSVQEDTSQPTEKTEEDNFPSHPGIAPEIYQQIKVFLLLVQRGKVDAAYDGIVRGSTIESETASIATLKEKTRQAFQLFGEIQGYEILELRKVGENLESVTILSLGEKRPLRWKLYFYHSRNAWRLMNIQVDDRLETLFGESESDSK